MKFNVLVRCRSIREASRWRRAVRRGRLVYYYHARRWDAVTCGRQRLAAYIIAPYIERLMADGVLPVVPFTVDWPTPPNPDRVFDAHMQRICEELGIPKRIFTGRTD